MSLRAADEVALVIMLLLFLSQETHIQATEPRDDPNVTESSEPARKHLSTGTGNVSANGPDVGVNEFIHHNGKRFARASGSRRLELLIHEKNSLSILPRCSPVKRNM
jgi:hypothetical protein